MNETEQHARATLEAQGFRVEPLPRGSTKTADFLVDDGCSSYLLEVTGKEEGESLDRLISEATAHGISGDSRPICTSDTLDGVIRRKARQLAATPVPADFQVLWIAAFHRDWEFLANLILRTLYGVAKLSAYKNPAVGLPTIHECIYYHYFSFYRDRNVDAVVFSTSSRGMLCVNALSERVERFRGTKFYRLFGNPIDPALAPEGVLMVDPEVDRTQPHARWRFLKDRYGLMTSEFVEAEWRGFASLPKNPE